MAVGVESCRQLTSRKLPPSARLGIWGSVRRSRSAGPTTSILERLWPVRQCGQNRAAFCFAQAGGTVGREARRLTRQSLKEYGGGQEGAGLTRVMTVRSPELRFAGHLCKPDEGTPNVDKRNLIVRRQRPRRILHSLLHGGWRHARIGPVGLVAFAARLVRPGLIEQRASSGLPGGGRPPANGVVCPAPDVVAERPDAPVLQDDNIEVARLQELQRIALRPGLQQCAPGMVLALTSKLNGVCASADARFTI